MSTNRFRLVVAIALGSALSGPASTLGQTQDASRGMFDNVVAGVDSTALAYAPANADAYKPLTAAQLIQLLAPVAVFPDKLVAQVLAAASYPEQIAEADRWSTQNKGLKGEALQSAIDAQEWDESVKAIVVFPEVLRQMAGNVEWMTSLGEAYANDPNNVMNAIQSLREQALACGNLKSNKVLSVKTTPRAAPPPADRDADVADDYPPVIPPPERIIEITTVEPDYVYVPQYDPLVFYGDPIAPWPGYAYVWPAPVYYGPAFGVFGFGLAIDIGFGWGHRHDDYPRWGWRHWGVDWGYRHRHADYGFGHGPRVVYDNNVYISRASGINNRYAGARYGRDGRPGFGPDARSDRGWANGGGRFNGGRGDVRIDAVARSGAGAMRFGRGDPAARSVATTGNRGAANFNRMTMPRFNAGMASRGFAPAAARGRADFAAARGAGPSPAMRGPSMRAPRSATPPQRFGTLASTRYAPSAALSGSHANAGPGGAFPRSAATYGRPQASMSPRAQRSMDAGMRRSNYANASQPNYRSARAEGPRWNSYAGGTQRSMSPRYVDRAGAAPRYSAMSTPRSSAPRIAAAPRSFQGGGAYGGRGGYSMPRSFQGGASSFGGNRGHSAPRASASSHGGGRGDARRR